MLTGYSPAPLPEHLAVVALIDPIVEANGFGPDHPYIEGALASRLGPSGVLLWRRLAHLVEPTDAPVQVDVVDTLACVGLGVGLGRNGVGARTVGRIIAYDLARRAGRDGAILAVRRSAAPLNAVQAARLPAGARAVHDTYTTVTQARRFAPGKLHVSPPAIAAMAAAGIDPAALLARHASGDWGQVSLEVALANNTAVTAGGTITSAYPFPRTTPVVTVTTDITVTARPATTINLANEHRSGTR